MTLTRESILAADDRETREVEVPEWGGSVLVKAMSGTERDAFEASMTKRRPALAGPNKGQLESYQDMSNVHAKLVARSIVDSEGKRVFSDADVAALGEKSAAALQRVWDVATELSGMADADAEENSEAVPSDGSTSSEQTPPESQ